MSGRYPMKCVATHPFGEGRSISRRPFSMNYSSNALSSEVQRKLDADFLEDEVPEIDINENIGTSVPQGAYLCKKLAESLNQWLSLPRFQHEANIDDLDVTESEEFYTPLCANGMVGNSSLGDDVGEFTPFSVLSTNTTSEDSVLSFRSAQSSLSNSSVDTSDDSKSSTDDTSSDEDEGIPTALEAYNIPFIDRNSLVYTKTRRGEFKMIGAGSYGNVYLADLIQTNGKCQTVVVKKFEEDEKNWKILQEGMILKCLEDTEYTPVCYGVSIDIQQQDKYLGLIQEYLADGLTLEKFLLGKPYLPKDVWLDLVKQLADGLERIHNKGVMVNDLKANNILIDYNNLDIYFIDFGLSTVNRGMTYNVTHALFKSLYLAPEVRMGERTSFSADVYSLGYIVSSIQRRAFIPELNDIICMCCEENKEDRPPVSCVKMLVAGV